MERTRGPAWRPHLVALEQDQATASGAEQRRGQRLNPQHADVQLRRYVARFRWRQLQVERSMDAQAWRSVRPIARAQRREPQRTAARQRPLLAICRRGVSGLAQWQ